jgi:hypothetical protein
MMLSGSPHWLWHSLCTYRRIRRQIGDSLSGCSREPLHDGLHAVRIGLRAGRREGELHPQLRRSSCAGDGWWGDDGALLHGGVFLTNRRLPCAHHGTAVSMMVSLCQPCTASSCDRMFDRQLGEGCSLQRSTWKSVQNVGNPLQGSCQAVQDSLSQKTALHYDKRPVRPLSRTKEAQMHSPWWSRVRRTPSHPCRGPQESRTSHKDRTVISATQGNTTRHVLWTPFPLYACAHLWKTDLCKRCMA